MYDAQIKRRRVVERDTEVPPDVGQGGDVAEHVEQLGGIVERGRVGRAGDGAIVFVDDVAVVERGDERGGFLGVSSYSNLFFVVCGWVNGRMIALVFGWISDAEALCSWKVGRHRDLVHSSRRASARSAKSETRMTSDEQSRACWAT